MPVGARFSAPFQAIPRAHPAFYIMGTGSFPGVKRLECGFDHSPPFNPWVIERVELLLHLWAFVVSSRANFTTTFTVTLKLL
jgi:hypothetical protein